MTNLKEMADRLYRRRKTHRLTLEQAGKQIGVSAATLSRIERRRLPQGDTKNVFVPDTRTLSVIADWLGMSTEVNPAQSGLASTEIATSDVPGIVAAHLRADPNLDDETAKALSDMFRLAYEQFSRLSQPDPKSGLHQERTDDRDE